jgi:hypothetical protein
MCPKCAILLWIALLIHENFLIQFSPELDQNYPRILPFVLGKASFDYIVDTNLVSLPVTQFFKDTFQVTDYLCELRVIKISAYCIMRVYGSISKHP